MTVGEKIQFYRKRAGLSQEELGQQLLVSRQTISLWETGQTLPTLDNLSRLRTIFGVSVDELLCEECADADGVEKPQVAALSYPCHEQEDRVGTRRILYVHAALTVLSLILLSFAVVSLTFAPVWPLFCVVAGAAVCFFCQAWLMLAGIDRIRAASMQNGAPSQEKDVPAGQRGRLVTPQMLAVSAITFVALLAVLVLALSGMPRRASVTVWILFVAALCVIACTVVGVLRRRGQRISKKCLLIGILLAALLITGGMGAVLRALPQPARDTQRVLGMPLPACESIVATEGGYASSELYVYYRVEFCFGDEEAVAWEAELAKPETPFLTPAPNALLYAPCTDFGRGAASFLLYDARENERVTALSGKGYHEYFLFAYFPNENLLSVAKCNLYVAE